MGAHEGHESDEEWHEEGGDEEGYEGHEGDESHEEGHEGNESQQDRQGKACEVLRLPREQGEDNGRLDEGDSDEEQVRQDREQGCICRFQEEVRNQCAEEVV